MRAFIGVAASPAGDLLFAVNDGGEVIHTRFREGDYPDTATEYLEGRGYVLEEVKSINYPIVICQYVAYNCPMQMWQLYSETNGGIVITGDRDILIAMERMGDLQREAENWRLAASYRRGVSASGGGGGSGRSIVVRWALASDVGRIERVLELNGRPRWEASEERFIVAEEGGEIFAVVATRTDATRLVLGEVVADPWGGEMELSVALYRNAVVLARRAGLDAVMVGEGNAEHFLLCSLRRGNIRWRWART